MDTDAKIAQVRAATPVVGTCAYLNTGSLGPVTTVFQACLDECTRRDLRFGRALSERYERMAIAQAQVVDEIAVLLGADSQDIALTTSTGSALRHVIDGLQLQPGDEIVTTEFEHHSCMQPLHQRAARSGLRLRIARRNDERSNGDIAWLTDELSEKTKLVVFSATEFRTGRCLPVEKIVAAARQCGALTLLDAAQAAGAIALESAASCVDFCALPLQKWLCGPEGLGALLMRRGVAELPTRPPVPVHGWGVFAAAAAQLRWMRSEIGWPWIIRRTAELARYAHDLLSAEAGVELLTPPDQAGLATVRLRFDSADRLAAAFRQRGIVVRAVTELSALRISAAYFNTENEIDRCVSAIFDCGRKL